MKNDILTVLAKIPSARVMVFGDVMLDHFIYGDAARLSTEAPVPVVRAMDDVWRPGGAANTAVNVKALGAAVEIVGVVGDDPFGDRLLNIIKAHDIGVGGLIKTPGRDTTYKARVLASRQQVVRIDRETDGDVPPDVEDAVVEAVSRRLDSVDAVILSDYGKGIVTANTAPKVIEEAGIRKKVITVDPKDQHFTLYRFVTSLTPNHREAARAVGADDRDLSDEAVDAVGARLLAMVKSDSVLITRGELGMALYESDGSVEKIPTRAREVFDVAGAGDTVIAAFTAALAAGAGRSASAHLANFAASVVVGKVGTAVASPGEIKKAIEDFYGETE